jgi:hypothetical protein
MSAVVVCRMRWLNALTRSWPLLFATIALYLCGASTWAQDEATSATVTAQGLVPEVSATSLPRFEPDGGTRTSRIDMTWLQPHRSALGLSLGMTSIDGLGLAVPSNLGNTLQSLDVGLHWRYTPDGNYRIDVTAWRRVTPQDAASLIYLREPSAYGARVEMRIGRAPVEPGFVAQRGFVGFQLESGARITVRRSGGKPMLYYRSNF